MFPALTIYMQNMEFFVRSNMVSAVEGAPPSTDVETLKHGMANDLPEGSPWLLVLVKLRGYASL